MPFIAPVIGFAAGALGIGAAAGMAGFAAGAAFAGTAFGAVTVKLLTSVAVSALATALAGKPKVKEAGIRTSTTMSGGTNPEGFILGTYATSGAMVCPPMSHGSAGKTPNAYLNYVIELGGKPGQQLAGLILDGEYVDILTDNPHADYGQRLGGRFEGRAWIRYYDGSQTAADPMLLSKYAPPYVRPWSADMAGGGICYAVLTFRFDREVFHGWPSVKFILRGLPVYDPRRDSTAGGSGPQRWGNPSTWAYSDNPAVLIYNILRGISFGQHIWGGSATADDLPYAIWAAAMDACDVLVSDGNGGQMRQYRAGFEVFAEDEPFSIIEELLTACAGSLSEHGGVWKLHCGAPGMPVAFITDDDIIISEPQDFEPFPTPESIYNGITGSYPDPDSLWETREAAPIFNPDWEAEDGGRRLPADMAFSAVWDPVQVQHLMSALIKDHRRMRVHVITLPPEAGALEPGDVISWTSEANFYSAKLFEVKAAIRDPRIGNVRASLREVDPADYDPPAGIVRPSPPDLLPALPAPQVVPGWAVSPHVLEDAEGEPRRPAIRASWDPEAADDARGVRVQVRPPGDDEIHELPLSDVEAGEAVYETVIPGEVYQMRGRIAAGRRTVWTDWISVIAPDVRVGVKDIAPSLAETIDQAQQDAQQAAQDAADAKAASEGLREYVDDTVDQAKTDMAVDYQAAVDAVASVTGLVQDAEDFKDLAEVAADQAQAAFGDAAAAVDAAEDARDAALSAQGVSEGAASAAAGSASTAEASATDAGNSATAAEASATTASGAAGQAETWRDQASSYADDAEGAASAASISEGLAVNAANNAGGSATSAASSASAASASATDAGQSASAAQTARTGAETARGQAETFADQAAQSQDNADGWAAAAAESAGVSVGAVLESNMPPSRFDEELTFWTSSRTGHPKTALSKVNMAYQDGKLLWTTNSHGGNILTRGVLPWGNGKAYRIEAKFRVLQTLHTDERADVELQWIGISDDFASASFTSTTGNFFEAGSQLYTLTAVFSDVMQDGVDVRPTPTNRPWARFGLRNNRSAQNLIVEVEQILITDVTAELNARASATSSSQAAASATDAGQSASAAQTARTGAETARGQAQTYSSNASTAADNAAGSAAAASTSAGLATTAANNSGGSAAAAANSAATAGAAATDAGDYAYAADQSRIAANTANTQAGLARDGAVVAREDAEGFAASAFDSLRLSSSHVAADLIKDGSFTLDFEHWPVGSLGPIVNRSTTPGVLAYGMPAARAIRIPAAPGTATILRTTDRFAVTRGETLDLSVWYRRSGSNSAKPRIGWNLVHEDGTITYPRRDLTGFQSDGTWEQYTEAITVPDTVTEMAFTIQKTPDDVASWSALVTGVSLKRRDGATKNVIADLETNYFTRVETNQAIANYDLTLNSTFEGLQSTVTNQATAISTLEGNASAGYLIKAQAGNQVSLLDLIAADGSSGSVSVARIAATDILLDGSVSMRMLTVTDFGNLIYDFDMRDPQAWNIPADWDHIQPGGNFRGAWGTRIDVGPSETGNSDPVLREFAAEGGADYHLSIEGRTYNGGTARLQLYATWWDRDGNFISPFSYAAEPDLTMGTPQTHGGTVTAPINAVQGRLNWRVVKHLSQGERIHVASPIVRKMSNAATLITPYSITTAELAALAVKAENIDVENLSAVTTRTGSLEVTDRLDILGRGSLSAFKPSPNDPTDGIFFGRDGGAGFSFVASRLSSGGAEQIISLRRSEFFLKNAKHIVSSSIHSAPVTVTNNQTVNLSGKDTLTMTIVGGGGGGGAVTSGDATAPEDGGNTVVRLRDGSTVVQTWTASGGGGGQHTGRIGESSVFAPAPSAGPGTLGAGGPGAIAAEQGSFNNGRGGTAGAAVEVSNRDISGLSDPNIIITRGAGGAGGTSGSGSGWAGGNGAVRYSTGVGTDIGADVVPITPTAFGSFPKVGLDVPFPDLGAGLWVLSVTGANNLDIGEVRVSPGRIISIRLDSIATFISSQTPVRTGGGNSDNRTINYLFYKMGGWA